MEVQYKCKKIFFSSNNEKNNNKITDKLIRVMLCKSVFCAQDGERSFLTSRAIYSARFDGP